MRWEKIGQIFTFDESPFKDRFASHAQSPQALVLDDRVRVYFSTREVDETGKFLSHVQYVDYDFDFKNILDCSEGEVVPLGKLGCFDEHGIFPLSPVWVGDKIYGPDQRLFLEFIEEGFTSNLARYLPLPRQALHASRIVYHLESGDMIFEAPLAADLAAFHHQHF